MDVLKDVLIEAGEIDRYFEDEVPVNLWRARKQKSPVPLFGLIEEEVQRPRGAPRPADISIEPVRGVNWVRVKKWPRGISTFDKPDVFKRGSWEYYKIPAGTKLPEGLVIVRDHWNNALKATHYTIAPAHDMPLKRFKDLLNSLASSLKIEVA